MSVGYRRPLRSYVRRVSAFHIGASPEQQRRPGNHNRLARLNFSPDRLLAEMGNGLDELRRPTPETRTHFMLLDQPPISPEAASDSLGVHEFAPRAVGQQGPDRS